MGLLGDDAFDLGGPDGSFDDGGEGAGDGWWEWAVSGWLAGVADYPGCGRGQRERFVRKGLLFVVV